MLQLIKLFNNPVTTNIDTNRSSTRASIKPRRLDYYRLGYSNVAYNNVWERDSLLIILDYVKHAFLTPNGTPLSYNDALKDIHSTEWKKAVQDELTSLYFR